MADRFNCVDTSLPFFAYGLFKKNELAYGKIKKYVVDAYDATVDGTLCELDGTVLLKKLQRDSICGSIICFRSGSEKEAYKIIDAFEPDCYKWDTVVINSKIHNCLLYNDELPKFRKRTLDYSSKEFEGSCWSSRNDPLFRECMLFLYDDFLASGYYSNAKRNKSMDECIVSIFSLQMRYVLLYTILNRFSDFKFGKQKKQNKKDENEGKTTDSEYTGSVHKECFRALYKFQKDEHFLLKTKGIAVRTGDVTSFHSTSNIEHFGHFFATVRNNAVHRGKGVFTDIKLLEASFLDLYYILLNYFNKVIGVKYPENVLMEVDKIYRESII